MLITCISRYLHGITGDAHLVSRDAHHLSSDAHHVSRLIEISYPEMLNIQPEMPIMYLVMLIMYLVSRDALHIKYCLLTKE